MILDRFLMEVEEVGHPVDTSRGVVNLNDLIDRCLSLAGDEVDLHTPFGSKTLNASDVRMVNTAFRHVLAILEQDDGPARLRVDLDMVSRSVACIGLSQLMASSLVRSLEIIYTESRYFIDGRDLVDLLKSDEFWHLVHEYPSRLVAIPHLPGRFDASLTRSVFVCGGLDFGRSLNLSARWEPANIHLVSPKDYVSSHDPELVGAFGDIVSREHSVGRTDLIGLLAALDAWRGEFELGGTQPLLVLGGWKLHSIVACLWALEDCRVPVFVCTPDFVSNSVTRVDGKKWKVRIDDTSVLV